MPVIDPNNPLSAIGVSNDPTLGDRTKGQAQGAIDLQNALGAIAAKGQNTRANTQLTGDLNQRNTRASNLLTEHQFDVMAPPPAAGAPVPDLAKILRDSRDLKNRTAESGINLQDSQGALARAKYGLGTDVPIGSPIADHLNVAKPSKVVPRVGDTSAAAGVPKTQIGSSHIKKVEQYVVVDGVLQKQTNTGKASVDTTEKGAIPPEIKAIQAAAEQMLPKGNYIIRQDANGNWEVAVPQADGTEKIYEMSK
jgi:hypothetical protein